MQAVHKNNDIEVLRAVAVIFTVLCHLGEMRWTGDWTAILPKLDFWGGVDLFFCISGFVIAGSLLRQPRPQTFRTYAIAFYIRRIFRIWPSALLWLIIPVSASIRFSYSFGHFKSVLGDATAAVLQVANIYYIFCTSNCGKEAVYWSLSLEEQFYMIFPVLLFFMLRQNLRYVLLLLIILQLPLHRPVESVLWFVRTDAICFGVLIALARHHKLQLHGAFDRLRARRSAIVFSCALIMAVAAISVASALWVNAGLLAVTAAALVWLASFDANIILPWRHIRPSLLWIGSRSYAIYLVHDPCFWAVREFVHRSKFNPSAHLADPHVFGCIAAAVVLIAVLSDLTYRFFETPMRKIGRRLAQQYEGRVSARVTSSART